MEEVKKMDPTRAALEDELMQRSKSLKAPESELNKTGTEVAKEEQVICESDREERDPPYDRLKIGRNQDVSYQTIQEINDQVTIDREALDQRKSVGGQTARVLIEEKRRYEADSEFEKVQLSEN